MKSTKIIDVIIEDTIEIVMKHGFSEEWLEDRIKTIVSMSEDVKTVITLELILGALSDACNPSQKESTESLVESAIHYKVYK